MNKRALKKALKQSIPILCSYVFISMAYGMLMAENGYPWYVALLASVIVYTGAFQFVLVSLLAGGASLLVQLFFLYFGLPKIGIKLSGEACAVIGLAFLGGAYMAESLRSGLEAVDRSQREAGECLGLTRAQNLRYVILPQAINLATRMIKTTSLVMLIGVVEVLKISQQIIDASRYDAPQATVFIYGVVFLMYFMVCWPISLLAGRLEKRWKE